MLHRFAVVAALSAMLGAGATATAATAQPGLGGGQGTVVTGAWQDARCAGGRDEGAVAGPGAGQPALLSLPNAYMAINGSLFALGDAFACARQLHGARVN